MPPTTLLWGASGKRWTLTDRLLAQAFTVWEASLCSCGCGGYGDECKNEDLQDEWEPRIGIHWRRAAIDQFKADHEQELKDQPGSYVYLADLRNDDE